MGIIFLLSNIMGIKLLIGNWSFFCLDKLEMSKIEEGDACDSFMSDIVPFVLPVAQRRFVLVEYSISPDEFVIKVSYDKDLFRHRYSRAVHMPLCEEIEEPNFVHTVVITITAN